ncbi:MAG: ATP-dependent DNA helicase RecG [Solirubrobacteraceae bacterium]
MARAFAQSTELTAEQLRLAPVRLPRPAVLDAALQLKGSKAATAAQVLGLSTVGDLLEHLPRDRRDACVIAELQIGQTATLVVQVKRIAARPVRRRGMRPLVQATVADATGSLRVTFFNQPWLAQRYPPGTRLVLHGKAEGQGRFTVQAHAPTSKQGGWSGGSDPSAGTLSLSVAHYPATDGLSSTQILALIHEHMESMNDTLEPLPSSWRRRERLLDRAGALWAAHFGANEQEVEAGRRRLAFEELLLAQIVFRLRRRDVRGRAAAYPLDAPGQLTARWLECELPFELTGDQRAAIETIAADLAGEQPMQRLLMGEVGSGKTVVALYAMLRALEHGFQAALMAPVEALAEQHFATIGKLLGSESVSVGLLTGSTSARQRAQLRDRLASGELALIVGTHALIEPDVRFSRLAVVVVDEQHRFGVRQRAALAGFGTRTANPHVLHMTATPIPRTLALCNYGELDFTVLRALPRGRQPIRTRVCSSDAEREAAYAQIRAEVDAGRQAFVVCPLVEESEALQARAATSEYERLRAGPLRGYQLVLMHGQMRAGEKQDAMARFASGAGQILVATTVIEVGIDVPNATVMLVEDADRYGLTQLHQLRGRVGRGEHPSTCLLFGRRDSRRLQAMSSESDGFRLAELDLEMRGQGDLVGTRQSGEADLRFVILPQDADLLERARRYALQVLEEPLAADEPASWLLGEALRRRYGDEAYAPIRV